MARTHTVRRWPLWLIASPAAVAVWSGWVGLGTMCGFGLVHPFPGIADHFELNTAITLPVGVEAYGAYALGAWLHPGSPGSARKFARRSAIGALALGMAGQVIYHLLAASRAIRAPWPVVVLVSCLPVITLGFGAALTHLLRAGHDTGAEPDTATATATASPDMQAVTAPDTAANLTADTPRQARRTPARTPKRTSGRTETGAAVARLRARHPDMTATDIAKRLGVTDRTVRRHLNPSPEPAQIESAAA
jgi:DNA-binding transcriptional ArsR family regulator